MRFEKRNIVLRLAAEVGKALINTGARGWFLVTTDLPPFLVAVSDQIWRDFPPEVDNTVTKGNSPCVTSLQTFHVIRHQERKWHREIPLAPTMPDRFRKVYPFLPLKLRATVRRHLSCFFSGAFAKRKRTLNAALFKHPIHLDR